ncbi:MAG: adenylate/guanylate cyclase domain-containing protein [Gallionella sp.]|nr:adenylate/guanylate cyclase domain-containing protein [Gallionella sp.]
MTKSIDNLVSTHLEKQLELVTLGRKIAQSATPVVVAFVDLSESTQMKQDHQPDIWLGYVFGFIQFIDQKCRAANGTTVKRIGDELMLTFSDVPSCEAFLQALIDDADSHQYTFKIALDTGDAYHFKFSENLADDPYGPVIDRCARIAKFAGAKTALCSSAYHKQVTTRNSYISVGTFSLRGIREPENLYVRPLVSVDTDSYLKPLLSAANESSEKLGGYRTIGRTLTNEYIRNFGSGSVRPFLARELINVPKLPYSAAEFAELLSSANVPSEKEKEFCGYLVEWDCDFNKFERNNSDLTIYAKLVGVTGYKYDTALLKLPLNYSEIILSFKKGQQLHLRGIIENIFLSSIMFNYVELSTTTVA